AQAAWSLTSIASWPIALPNSATAARNPVRRDSLAGRSAATTRRPALANWRQISVPRPPRPPVTRARREVGDALMDGCPGLLRSSLVAKITWATIHGRTFGTFAIVPDREDQVSGHPRPHSSS